MVLTCAAPINASLKLVSTVDDTLYKVYAMLNDWFWLGWV
jgi:hypothetical protein